MPLTPQRTLLRPYWQTDDDWVRLYLGNVTSVLDRMPARSVQCVVTSPPYWGLRDYGTGTWEGGDPACNHVRSEIRTGRNLASSHVSTRGGAKKVQTVNRLQFSGECGKCGAVRVDQQIGSEPSPDCLTWGQAQCGACFVCVMVKVFRAVRRVLRDDGTLWLNLGDTYAGGGRGPGGTTKQKSNQGSVMLEPTPDIGIPGGNLVGVPWRVALALQADGWILRQEVIWHKPSPMPECLDPQTRVFVRVNGWVSRTTLARVYDMPVKPEVLGPNGWVKVLNIWKTRKPAMLLEAGKAERVICSPDHKFPVSHDNGNARTEDKPASDIRATGYKDYLLYHPIGKHLTPTLKEWEGVGLTGHLGYVVGLYAAEGSHDGGHRMKWTIHKDEEYIRRKFNKSLRELGLKGQAFPDPKCNAQNLVTVSDWLQRTIWTFVLGRDARTKRLNVELLLNSPEDFRRRLLEGYIDGDGSDRGDGWGAVSASRELRDDLSTLASSLGVVTSKGYSGSKLPGRDKEYHSHGLWTPYINRSAKKGADGTYQILPRGRKTLDGERDMIDMEVEGGLFLIGDGLVTHNSVRNRCTKAHEQVFLLTKRMGYYYDLEAIKEKSRSEPHAPQQTKLDASRRDHNRTQAVWAEDGKSNKRSVWTISSQGYPGAHFATFPPRLVEPCIKAGTSARGCCGQCGAPWSRVTLTEKLFREAIGNTCANTVAGVKTTRLGWKPGCMCYGFEIIADPPRKFLKESVGGYRRRLDEWKGEWEILGQAYEELETVPCTVLDPFIGSGTTAAVCLKLGRRRCWGIDLNEKYLRENAIPRIEDAEMGW